MKKLKAKYGWSYSYDDPKKNNDYAEWMEFSKEIRNIYDGSEENLPLGVLRDGSSISILVESINLKTQSTGDAEVEVVLEMHYVKKCPDFLLINAPYFNWLPLTYKGKVKDEEEEDY